jgi:general secretion pathway protein E
MVGEIRDKESMEYTMQAALTGRLIITSLHTHNAPSAIVRLVNTGTQPLLVESTVTAVVAQRLIRRICDHCAELSVLTEDEVLTLGLSDRHLEKANLRKGEGCTTCRGTGYLGQTAIFEIMEMTDQLGALIRKGAGAQALENAARKQGMRTLKDKAIEKMLEGVTTPEEVLRVTGGLTRSVPHKFKSRIILNDKEH